MRTPPKETGTLWDVEGGIRWLAAEVERGRRIVGGRRIVRREWRRGNRGGIVGSKETIVRIVRTFFRTDDDEESPLK